MAVMLRKKILIVDDEKPILTTLSQLLRHSEVEVVLCSEIEEAEVALANAHFDLVIADIRMSGFQGIEGLELLSFIKQNFSTEVMIMTGYGTKDIEDEAYRRGAYFFFRKPIAPLELLQKISELGIPVTL